MGQRCEMVMQQIVDRLTKLWDEFSADGVQDVVYVQYSDPKRQNLDFALANGDGIKQRCHLLETADIVMGYIPDGIHPSKGAFDRLGQAVFKLMVIGACVADVQRTVVLETFARCGACSSPHSATAC